MKFEKVFKLDKEKDAEKVYKALENGKGREYLDQFMAETKAASAMDLNKASTMITESFVCDYSNKKQLVIIPTKEIINVYNSNCFYGNYNYDYKAVAVETKSDETFYLARQSRAQKVEQATQAFMELEKRAKSNEGSLIA